MLFTIFKLEKNFPHSKTTYYFSAIRFPRFSFYLNFYLLAQPNLVVMAAH